MIVDLLLEHPVVSVLGLLFVLELYLRSSGTEYDSQVRVVRDSLVWVLSVVSRGKDSGSSSEGDESGSGKDGE